MSYKILKIAAIIDSEIDELMNYFGIPVQFEIDQEAETSRQEETFQLPVQVGQQGKSLSEGDKPWIVSRHLPGKEHATPTHPQGHNGIDLKAPRGTPVYPIASGTVLRTGVDPKGGNVVYTSHNNGDIVAYYAHLEEIFVQPGQKINKNTPIGSVGDSGNAKGRGAHLHYEVKIKKQRVDPLTLVNKNLNIFANKLFRIKVLKDYCKSNRINNLRKIAIMEIKFSPKEEQLINLLMDVVKNKTPSTTLRIAGGYVRDKLLGKSSNDIDIAVDNMSGEQFANIVHDYLKEKGFNTKDVSVVKANPDQSKHLATAMLNVLGFPIDFVNLRKEEYAQSRIPTVEPGTPEEDASRRDLTINALFYNLNERKIEDFTGGLKDLQAGIARTPIDPIQTWIDDPLRILRTIRFAAKYNLELSPELIEAGHNEKVQEAFRTKVSPERIWKELGGQNTETGEWKSGFMSGPNPVRAARLLAELGFRDILFGLSDKEMEELGIEKGMTSFDVDQNNPHHDLTIWEHTLSVLEHLVFKETTEDQHKNYEDVLVRNLAALLHDIGKCDLCARQITEENYYTYHGHAESSAKIAEYVLKRMRAPNNIIKRVKRLVEEHMRLHGLEPNVSDKALRKFIRDLEDDWRHSLDLAIADAHGKKNKDADVRNKYDEFRNRIDEILKQLGGTKAKPPISGKDLIDMGFKPGPAIGKALKELHEKLLEQPSLTREEAINFINSLSLI